jgi:hypothetical protein
VRLWRSSPVNGLSKMCVIESADLDGVWEGLEHFACIPEGIRWNEKHSAGGKKHGHLRRLHLSQDESSKT